MTQPASRGPRATTRSHRWVDERSRALHAAVAERLRENPSLRFRALANLDRWEGTGDARNRGAHREWRRLLTGEPLDVLLAVLTEESEHATELRQNSPFAGILSAGERLAIFRRFEGI